MSVRPAGTRWYNTVWRWHFYAGLICVPFVVWLAVTGTLYLWRPQIETWLDRPFDHLATAGPIAAPDAQIGAALRAVPGATLDTVVLPQAPDQALRVLVADKGIDRRVYIDPRSLAVLAIVTEAQRPLNVVMRLHGQLLAGAIGSSIVEIAACWAIVMLLTGLYLWWPRGRGGLAGVLYPRLRLGRRVFWRDIHASTGLWVSMFALALIVTGLPWAAAWGGYLAEIRQLTGAVRAPVDWTIGGRPPAGSEPVPGVHAGHGRMAMPAPPLRPGELARVMAAVRPLRLAPPVLIAPPAHDGARWSVTSDAADRPLRADVEIDGATGRVAGRIDFAQRHWIDRLIGYGIALHEGALFGLANQLLGTLTALFLVLLAGSGAIQWWRRRPAGRIGAPLPLSRPRFRGGLIALIAALAIAMPLFGATLLLVLLADATILRAAPRLRLWLGLRRAATC